MGRSLTDFGKNSLTRHQVNHDLPTNPSPEVQQLVKSLDANKPETAEQFGLEPQRQLDEHAKQIINAVKTRDAGKTGQELAGLEVAIKSTGLKPAHGLLGRWFNNGKKSLMKLQSNYQAAGVTIDTISEELKKSADSLNKDNQTLQQLFVENQDYYKELQIYVDAGKLKLHELDTEIIPAKEKDLDPNDVLGAQDLESVRAYRERLGRRVYDLMAAQQLTVQQGPQIRIAIQGNNVLADRINETISNAVPIWRRQMAMQMLMIDQQNRLKIEQAAADMTQDVIKRGSGLIKKSAIGIAKESQRGIIDIETLQKVQQDTLDTIKSVRQINTDATNKRKANAKLIANMTMEYQDEVQSLARRNINAEEVDNRPLELTDSDQAKKEG